MTSTHSRSLAVALFAATWLLAASPGVQAQTKVTMRFKEVHYQVADGMLPVGDSADGRLVGVWARRGVTRFEGRGVAPFSALGD